jgi:hypothetical protein
MRRYDGFIIGRPDNRRATAVNQWFGEGATLGETNKAYLGL